MIHTKHFKRNNDCYPLFIFHTRWILKNNNNIDLTIIKETHMFIKLFRNDKSVFIKKTYYNVCFGNMLYGIWIWT